MFERSRFIVKEIRDIKASLRRNFKQPQRVARKRKEVNGKDAPAVAPEASTNEVLVPISEDDQDIERNENRDLHPFKNINSQVVRCDDCGRRMLTQAYFIHMHEYHSGGVDGDDAPGEVCI